MELVTTAAQISFITAHSNYHMHLKIIPDLRANSHFCFFKIMCKGNLVLSGITKENLPSDEYLESSVFHTPLPHTPTYTTIPFHYTPTHPFIKIPKPTVQEFEIKFNVTQAMVPSCRILVYYIRSDKETVGDSIVYDIEDKLENEVKRSVVVKTE